MDGTGGGALPTSRPRQLDGRGRRTGVIAPSPTAGEAPAPAGYDPQTTRQALDPRRRMTRLARSHTATVGIA